MSPEAGSEGSLQDSGPGSRDDAGDIPRASYHNHTTWSDGLLTPDELVQRAIELGLVEIGICDHAFTLKGGVHCVQDHQIRAYCAMVDDLRERNRGVISVLAGLEVDTSAQNPRRSSLPLEDLGRLDYLLFEYVGEAHRGGFTFEELIEVRRNLNCGVALAHPNMPALVRTHGAVPLARTLAENNILIDACGSRRNSRPGIYQRPGVIRAFALNIEGMGEEFKEAARAYGVGFFPSSDTHSDDGWDALADTAHAWQTIGGYRLPFGRLLRRDAIDGKPSCRDRV